MASTTTENIISSTENKFGTAEYSVFASLLAASVGIGVYYGFFGKNKNQSNDDFLMAGRNMSIMPVALSLICSFVSAITLLGNPVEVYYYGSQYLLIASSFIPITLALAYLYVPVFFKLQLTSAYEYFELRFNRTIRMCMSVISIIYLVLLMSIWVYAPGLALDEVAGINIYLSCGLTFVVCIFYSSLGGLKAVLWTDALQASMMLCSLAAVVGKGITDMGGLEKVWERAENTSRIEFINFDPDPRTRHTFWTGTIGGYFMWLPLYAATQSQIQRYLSVSTLKKARITLLINMIGLIVIVLLCFLAGMGIYARYWDCDPLEIKRIKSADQLLPLFVMDTLGEYPGLPGLFVAGIVGASLSSVSSALNSLSAIITEDYVKKYRPGLSDQQMAFVSKIVCLLSGVLAYGFVFIAGLMGDIFSIGLTMVGTFLGPSLGLFTLGMFFPTANARGSLIGLVGGIAAVLFVAVGSTVRSDDLPNQKLNISTHGCVEEAAVNDYFRVNTDWKDKDDSAFIQVISLAPNWYPGLGTVVTVLLSLILSPFLKEKTTPLIKRDYLSPPILKIYDRFLPASFMDKYVEADDPDRYDDTAASVVVHQPNSDNEKIEEDKSEK